VTNDYFLFIVLFIVSSTVQSLCCTECWLRQIVKCVATRGSYANEMPLTIHTPVVSLCDTSYDIKKFYVLFAPYIYIIFFMDLRTNGGYFLASILLLYNRDGLCLLRGTD
jgi:hypothetical protein